MEAIQDHEENMKHVQSMERSTHMDSVATMYIKPSISISISTVIIQCPLHLLALIYSPNRKSSIVHTQAGSPPRLDCRGHSLHTNGLAATQNSAEGSHTLPPDVNTDFERMQIKLLSQLK